MSGYDPILVEMLGHRVKLQIRMQTQRRADTVYELQLVERMIEAYRQPMIRFRDAA